MKLVHMLNIKARLLFMKQNKPFEIFLHMQNYSIWPLSKHEAMSGIAHLGKYVSVAITLSVDVTITSAIRPIY